MLSPEFTPHFERDIKHLQKKHVDLTLLKEVIRLVLRDDDASLSELRRRHRMHELRGAWQGARECHVANIGNWLCVWQVADGLAIFLRTGSHDEIFQ